MTAAAHLTNAPAHWQPPQTRHIPTKLPETATPRTVEQLTDWQLSGNSAVLLLLCRGVTFWVALMGPPYGAGESVRGGLASGGLSLSNPS